MRRARREADRGCRAWYNRGELAAYTQDDGFHEIQLNGKQLVFLFMAATVVSVVIFLCGVLVGRGVRVERGDFARTAVRESSSIDVTPAPPTTTTPVPSTQASDPTVAAPPPAVDELSYFNRLEKPTPPVETLKPAAEKARPVPARGAGAASPLPADAVNDGVAATPAQSQGYAVQIAALNVRSEADAMARRLASKGFAAYVLTPANGTPAVYRVRIGTFKTRREAEAMAARLQKEEQFKPWITK
jgi:cell division septation protein DedD